MAGVATAPSPLALLLRTLPPIALIALPLAGCDRGGHDAAAPSGGAGDAAPAAPAGDLFVERAASSGLDFVHFNGMSGELYLQEITCGAGALLDYDGDGDLDAFLLQGTMIGAGKTLADALSPPRHPPPLTGRLYRNDLAAPRAPAGGAPRLAFTDVTLAMGARATGYGCGVAVGDVDNDGRPDVYVANVGPNQLLRNRGDGTFEDATARAGVGDDRSGVAAVFFDYDRDGWLDLFVGNNVAFDNTGATVCRSLAGAPDYCGPGAYPFQQDRLYRNRGDGTFEDATARAGIAAAPPRPTLGAIAADLTADGWPDLYVANDGEPNHFWVNRRDGTFTEEAMLAGCAVDGSGAAEASMGVDAGDYDGDGDLDVFLTHLIKETNTLYRNDGRGLFDDHTQAAGLAAPSLPYTSFGTAWFDYDNDGWLDLLVVNGAVTLLPELVRLGDPFPLHQVKQLFHNLGPGGGAAGGPPGEVRFEEVTDRAGVAFRLSEVGRGTAFGDVDDDGDTDALVVNNNGPARLLINEVGNRRPWLGLRLVGGDPPRDMLGALVRVVRPGRPPLVRRVHTDGSYSSASDPRVLVGLGDHPAVERIEVLWPDGTTERFAGPPAGRYTTLRQGG
jgi:hypothetical protein